MRSDGQRARDEQETRCPSMDDKFGDNVRGPLIAQLLQ